MKVILALLFAVAASAQVVVITGTTSGGGSIVVQFKKATPPPTLKALFCSGSTDASGAIVIQPGGVSQCTVTISRPADPPPAVTQVQLVSSDPSNFTVPAFVLIQPNSTSSPFLVTATTSQP